MSPSPGRAASAAAFSAGLLLALFARPACGADLLSHARGPLRTPTYEGSGQVVEPDVLWFPAGWNGYEFWMVVTPYPCGEETAENPSILASHDGVAWETPVVGGVAAPAPLVANDEWCVHYAYANNDPCLVLVGDTLAVYYFVTWNDGPKYGTTELRRVVSPDGVHWTPGADAPVLWTTPNYVLSPSVVHDGHRWRLWYVRSSSCGSRLAHARVRESGDGIDWPDSTDRPVGFDAPGLLPFHLTVKPTPAGFAMLYVAYPAGRDCGQANTLYYAESTDGETWSSLSQPLLSPSADALAWDNRSIYRSTFVGRYPDLGVWYSACSNEACLSCDSRHVGPVWHAGFTSVGDFRSTPPEVAESPRAGSDPGLTVSPNPSRGAIDLRFDLGAAGVVRAEVFDLFGRRVARLADEAMAPGPHTVHWNGFADSGRPTPAGLYLVRVSGTGGRTWSRRFVRSP